MKHPQVSLWHYAEVNPVTSGFQNLSVGEDLSFMPLESIWSSGAADYSHRKAWKKSDTSYTQFQRGDILVPKVTPTVFHGRSMIADIDSEVGLATSEVHVLRPRGNVDPRWLTYNLVSGEFLDRARGEVFGVGGLQRISAGYLGSYKVPQIPLDTQKRIADYLDRETAEIDEMIRDLNQNLTPLGQRKRQILSKLLQRYTSPNDAKPIWSLYRAVKELNHPEETVLSVYREHGVIPKDSRDDNHNRTPENVSTYQLVEEDDLVVNKMKAWQGSLAVSEHRGIVSPDYQVAKPITDDLPKYLHYALRSPELIDQYRVYSTGIRPAQWRLYWEEMSRLMIPVHSVEIQRQIVEELDRESTEIDSLLADSTTLRAQLRERRTVLITEVVTGRKEI